MGICRQIRQLYTTASHTQLAVLFFFIPFNLEKTDLRVKLYIAPLVFNRFILKSIATFIFLRSIMIELAVALFFIFLLRYKTQRPWIWVIPNAGVFALGFVMSITWLSGTPAEGLSFWEYRILGFAPLFLFLGPLGGYWLYGKTNRSGISNIPVFIGCLGACLCIWYVADYLPQISQ